MASSENTAASKLFLDFIRDFTLLTERQLAGSRSQMIHTVEDIMSSIHAMSETSDLKKRQANEVLIKSQTNSGNGSDFESFILSDSEGVVSNHDATASELDLRRAGGRFSKHMEAISTLDEALQKLLFSVMGAVSADDVIGQRLSHTVLSIQLLNKSILELLRDIDKNLTRDFVVKLKLRVLNEVYRGYTMEEERETFHRIFGYPKKNNGKQAA